jgi:MoxR-like ATPase
VLRHRIVLTYEALADGLDADALLDRVLDAVDAPEISLSRVEAA